MYFKKHTCFVTLCNKIFSSLIFLNLFCSLPPPRWNSIYAPAFNLIILHISSPVVLKLYSAEIKATETWPWLFICCCQGLRMLGSLPPCPLHLHCLVVRLGPASCLCLWSAQ
jgi:hypothetical protein